MIDFLLEYDGFPCIEGFDPCLARGRLVADTDLRGPVGEAVSPGYGQAVFPGCDALGRTAYDLRIDKRLEALGAFAVAAAKQNQPDRDAHLDGGNPCPALMADGLFQMGDKPVDNRGCRGYVPAGFFQPALLLLRLDTEDGKLTGLFALVQQPDFIGFQPWLG